MRRIGKLAAVAMAVVLAGAGCREVVYDIMTNERIVTVPASNRTEFTIDTGLIELPSKLGTDKTIDSSTLDLTATNSNALNPVDVVLSSADSRSPNAFREVATFSLEPLETKNIIVVQTEPDDPLVTATQSDAVNIRFDSTSPSPGLGVIEFRFTIHVLAHKRTPGTGAGTFLFY
jgi:hypothetical protein